MLKGSKCSFYGKKYEMQVYNIVKNCFFNTKPFNTQDIKELGGCTSTNDIQCNFQNTKDLSIEIKKYNTPDWMQCSLCYDVVNKKWIGSKNNKIPHKSKSIFENFLQDIKLFNGNIPPFLEKNMTYEEWTDVKSKTTDFNDEYFSCPNDTIKNLYKEKGCAYIQISEKGLYHLGGDICSFGVPEFICEQEMRVRIKVHSTRNAKGFCSLSVTISCKPKNLKDLPISLFSLDNTIRLPKNLVTNTTEIIHNISPLRYPGGKTRACHILETIMLKHFDITKFDTLLSPFLGGASFEFYIQNNYGLFLCVNDKFTPLYNFWKQVQSDKHTLCAELRKITSVSKDDFLLYRKEINDGDLVQQALRYFVINRCSFSGATFSGGFSLEASTKRFTLNSIQKIEELNLNKVELCNYDFQEFLEKHYQKKGTLIFLDPPYYLEKKSKLYGNNGDLHENFDHQKLYDVIISKKNWILTYNDCAYIRNLYKDFIICEINWKYGMNKSKESCEIVIINP